MYVVLCRFYAMHVRSHVRRATRLKCSVAVGHLAPSTLQSNWTRDVSFREKSSTLMPRLSTTARRTLTEHV